MYYVVRKVYILFHNIKTDMDMNVQFLYFRLM